MVEVVGPNETKMTVKNYKDFYDIEKVGQLVKERAK